MRLPIIVGIPSYKLSSTTKNFLQSIFPIGIILFSKNIQSKEQLAQLISDIKNFDPELLISIDFEGGAIHRFSPDIPVVASAKAMSRPFYWQNIQQNIEYMAQTLSFFGIDINFAPVLDIVREDTDLVLQNRGFFPDPQLITYYNEIFWQAHQKYGVHSSVKHFAGLSKISQDPHTKVTLFEGTSEDFELGLSCYQKLPEDVWMQSVMTSHIIYPHLDELPVTFSSSILSKYLRQEIGFQGIVFTDCLEMKASSTLYPPAQIATKALQAGHDILISSGQIFDISYCQELAVGIKNYLQQQPLKAKQLEHRISLWKEALQKQKTNTNNLPDYKQVVEHNKIFIEKKIYSSIKKIGEFHLFYSEQQGDILAKFQQEFPLVNSSLIAIEKQEVVDLQEKTLVLVLDGASSSEEKDFLLKQLALAKQVLIISINTMSNFLCNEQWILWGKNHLLLDSLLALFLEKTK